MQLAFAFVQYGTLPMNILRRGVSSAGNSSSATFDSKKPTNVDARLKLAEAYEEIQDHVRLKEAYQNAIKIMIQPI